MILLQTDLAYIKSSFDHLLSKSYQLCRDFFQCERLIIHFTEFVMTYQQHQQQQQQGTKKRGITFLFLIKTRARTSEA